MRKFSIYISIVSGLTACGILGPDNSAKSYFPLTVGNKWYYSPNLDQDLSRATKWEVIDTRTIGRKRYYVVERSRFSHRDSLFYRQESDRVIELHFGEDGKTFESTFADFGLEKPKVFYYFAWTIQGEDRYFEVSLKNRSFDKTTFYYDEMIAVDEENSITFQSGVGISEFYGDAWDTRDYLIHRDLK